MAKTTTHIGVYGVIKKKDSILLIKKSRGPYKNLHDLPGGRLEPGETFERTLVREIQEETGIIHQKWTFIDRMNHHCSFSQGDQCIDFHHIGHIFMIDEFDDSGMNFHICSEDVDGCQWWPMSNPIQFTPFAKQCCPP
ncbi:MAG: NUDIX domain-containing protein [Chlamydiota bacterium]